MTSREGEPAARSIPSCEEKKSGTKNYNKKEALWKSQKRAITPYARVI
jgi:hypothetical protein